MPDISAALTLLEKPIAALSGVAVGKSKDLIAHLRAKHMLRNLYQKLNSTQKVKTLWTVDRAVALSSFYYPAKLRTKSGALQAISRLDELPTNAVVLVGIVGQGKSILLRHLLGREIRSGTRVPLLVELRRLPPEGLAAYLQQQFDELMETSGSPDIFRLFAENGRLSILIDGFDEVDPDRTQEVIGALEALALKFPTSRIVVTSRPNSGIEASPHFDVIPIAPLSEEDFLGFFLKLLPRDRDLAARITQALKSSPAQVKQLATTPLLATQLTVVYRAIQRIPSDFTEFYDELFSILLVRHDRSKKGWERKRKTGLSDREIQQLFEAYCFKSKAAGVSSVPRSRALELAASAAESTKLNCDEAHFLHDIEKVTCLLQEEGGRVEFLHQSVQEFFAARYVVSRPETLAKDFYSFLIDEGRWKSWDQVLRFLNQIDQYRASKHFYIPALRATVSFLTPKAGPELEHLRTVCAESVGVNQVLKKPDGTLYPEPKYFINNQSDRVLLRQSQIDARMFDTLFGAANKTGGKWSALFDRTTHDQFKSYAEIAKGTSCLPDLDAALLGSLSTIRTELAEHVERVRVFDESRKFMGLQGI